MKLSLSFIKQITLFQVMVAIFGVLIVGYVDAKISSSTTMGKVASTQKPSQTQEKQQSVIRREVRGSEKTGSQQLPGPKAMTQAGEAQPMVNRGRQQVPSEQELLEQDLRFILNTPLPWPWNSDAERWVRNNWGKLNTEQQEQIKKYNPALFGQPTTTSRSSSTATTAEPLRYSPRISEVSEETQGLGEWISEGFEKAKRLPGVVWSRTKEAAYRFKIRLFREVAQYKEKLEEIINKDRAAYPTVKIAIDALNDDNELFGQDLSLLDVSDRVKNMAKDELIKGYNATYASMDQGQKTWEDAILAQVKKFRRDLKADFSNPSNARAYANKIKTEGDLAYCQAVVSEYYRALDKADALEKISKMLSQPAPSAK